MDFFSEENFQLIRQHPQVELAKRELEEKSTVSFFIENEEISKELREHGFPGPSQIPLRWIRGDTAEHIDRGKEDFKNTFLVYLSGNGKFIVGQDTHTIQENSAFMFDEGIRHFTKDASTRLLLGPMNEYGNQVGTAPPYPTDVFSYTNAIHVKFIVNSLSDPLKVCSATDNTQNFGVTSSMIEYYVASYSVYPPTDPPTYETFSNSQAVCSFTSLSPNTEYTITLFNSYSIGAEDYFNSNTSTYSTLAAAGEEEKDYTWPIIIGILVVVVLYIIYMRLK